MTRPRASRCGELDGEEQMLVGADDRRSSSYGAWRRVSCALHGCGDELSVGTILGALTGWPGLSCDGKRGSLIMRERCTRLNLSLPHWLFMDMLLLRCTLDLSMQ